MLTKISFAVILLTLFTSEMFAQFTEQLIGLPELTF